jgi:hypothetical protein
MQERELMEVVCGTRTTRSCNLAGGVVLSLVRSRHLGQRFMLAVAIDVQW